MGMSPLLTHFQKETLDNMISKYQYVLKAPVETGNGEAENIVIHHLIFHQRSLTMKELVSMELMKTVNILTLS